MTFFIVVFAIQVQVIQVYAPTYGVAVLLFAITLIALGYGHLVPQAHTACLLLAHYFCDAVDSVRNIISV